MIGASLRNLFLPALVTLALSTGATSQTLGDVIDAINALEIKADLAEIRIAETLAETLHNHHEIHLAQGMIQNVQASIDALEIKADLAEIRIAETLAETLHNHNEIHLAQNKIDDVQSGVDALEIKADLAEIRIAETLAETLHNHNEIHLAQNKIDDVQSGVDALESKADLAEVRVAEILAETMHGHDEIHLTQTKVDDVHAAVDAVQNGVDALETKTDALGADLDSRLDQWLRLEIEKQLAIGTCDDLGHGAEPSSTPARFYLPDSCGGWLEDVRDVVGALILDAACAGFETCTAEGLWNQAVASLGAGAWKNAWCDFLAAYQSATTGSCPGGSGGSGGSGSSGGGSGSASGGSGSSGGSGAASGPGERPGAGAPRRRR